VRVHIYDIAVTSSSLPDVEFTVTCSSGTYMRAIARDVGAHLGTGGYLTGLRRTRVGRHDVDDAIPLSALADEAQVKAAALSSREALAHLQAVEVSEAEARALSFGQSIGTSLSSSEPIQLTRAGELIAIARVEGAQLRPHKVFVNG
jgi:tRNA pseudouridine55 synthase